MNRVIICASLIVFFTLSIFLMYFIIELIQWVAHEVQINNMWVIIFNHLINSLNVAHVLSQVEKYILVQSLRWQFSKDECRLHHDIGSLHVYTLVEYHFFAIIYKKIYYIYPGGPCPSITYESDTEVLSLAFRVFNPSTLFFHFIIKIWLDNLIWFRRLNPWA